MKDSSLTRSFQFMGLCLVVLTVYLIWGIGAGEIEPEGEPQDKDAIIAELQDQIVDLHHRLDRAEEAVRQAGGLTEERRVLEPVEPVWSPELTVTLAWLTQLAPGRFGDWSQEELSEVSELDLSGLTLSAEDLLHLQNLHALKTLNLERTSLTDTELASLANLDLEILMLRGALITDAGLAHLQGMVHLQHLALDGTEIGDEGLGKLLHLSSLKTLSLDGTKITDAGLSSLAGLSLEILRIGQTQVGDAGLATLESFQLHELSLHRNTNITDAGMRHLQGQTSLETLNLRGMNITEAGLSHLQGLSSLKELNASMAMTDAGMFHLSKLGSIEQLGLYSNPEITDAGIAHLQNLKTLQLLRLQFTGITDQGLGYLENLPDLRFLDIRGSGVTQAAYDAFRERHPNCRVLR